MTPYQAEYGGIVQYYRLAYNLHTLHMLKHVMEVSMVRTCANKYRTTCTKMSQRCGNGGWLPGTVQPWESVVPAMS